MYHTYQQRSLFWILKTPEDKAPRSFETSGCVNHPLHGANFPEDYNPHHQCYRNLTSCLDPAKELLSNAAFNTRLRE